MFWRFGFQQPSAIESLLERENLSVELILDEDDLLQECKSQNAKLVTYLQRVEVLERLLGYVSGQVEGEERGRFKYPYVAAEVLCSEIWTIVETCVSKPELLLIPWWNYVLDLSPRDLAAKSSIASHFAKINAVFLSKKPDEMLHIIRSLPNLVGRLLAHIESPSIVDLIFRILQLDEQPGDLGVTEWLSSERLIPQVIDLLSPIQPPELHQVVADFLKGIITFSSPSPNAFPPVNPTTMSMLGGDPTAALPPSNRLARELAHRSNVLQLVEYMLCNPSDLVDLADSHSPSTSPSSSATENLASDLGPSPADRAVSSLVNIIPVFIELIRKNNSDLFEPYLFHALRNRLIQIRQRQQDGFDAATEEANRDELEKAMNELVDHMGLVHLGFVLELVGERLKEFQTLLREPRASTVPHKTTTGLVVPLTFERFRICELYAEMLHCSNMMLLNRNPEHGPAYDEDGRLLGGLPGLEKLARVVGGGSNDPDSPRSEDPGHDVSTPHAESPSPSIALSSSIGSTSTDGDGDLKPADDGVLEKVALDSGPLPVRTQGDIVNSPNPSPSHPRPPAPSPSSDDDSPDPSSFIAAISLEDTSVGSDMELDLPSPGSQTTVITAKKTLKHTLLATPCPGNRLKQQFIDLGVISDLLDLFFEFPLNNFLHNVVYDILHQILTGSVDQGLNRELVISLFRDCRILERIIEGQHQNDEACSKPNGCRAGFMGHLTLISEDIVSAFDHYPPDLIEILSMYAPRPEWDQYVSGKYKETRDKDQTQLGGGKPVLGLGLGGFSTLSSSTAITARKVDEGDDIDIPSSSEVPPYSAQTEEPEGSTHHRFAQYLASQMASSEAFSSSSSDNSSEEDDGTWLDTANRNFQFDEPGDFELPVPSSSALPRAENAFDDSFDGPAIVAPQDPFHGDSDDDDAAWGPFSDSNLPRDPMTDSISSSFTLGSDDDGGFVDSFGDDFGDFQAASPAGSLSEPGGS